MINLSAKMLNDGNIFLAFADSEGVKIAKYDHDGEIIKDAMLTDKGDI